MKNIFYITLILLFLPLSCAKNQLVTNEVETNIFSSNPYKVSQQEALNELQQFLQSLSTKSLVGQDKNTLNSLSQKKIGTIQAVRTSLSTKMTLTKSMIRTKSDVIEEICVPDTLLYIVNFDDDGFAILSADSRISSSVLAVVESGTISPLHFDVIQYLNEQFSSDSLIYTYYQFYEEDDEDFDDEIDYNDLLDAEEDDEGNSNHDYTGNHYLDTPEEIVGSMVYDYAIDEIINSPIPDPLSGFGPDINTQVGGDTLYGGGWSSPDSYTYWLTIQEVPALLTTMWDQSDSSEIINKYTPIKQDGKHAPLGCGAVAVSQILAYNEHPKHFTLNGIYFDWEKLKSVQNISNYRDSSIVQTAEYEENMDLLAKFMYLMGRICKTKYREGSSWTLAKNYRNAFYVAVYRNVHKLIGYHGNTIINMLNNSAPVLISAGSHWSIGDPFEFGGHTWVIDGYKIQKKVETNFGSYVGERILLHCNWGWGGDYNGYYESKIFKLKYGAIENEWYEINQTGSNNYNWAYRIYSYDKPNN